MTSQRWLISIQLSPQAIDRFLELWFNRIKDGLGILEMPNSRKLQILKDFVIYKLQVILFLPREQNDSGKSVTGMRHPCRDAFLFFTPRARVTTNGW